MKNQIVKSKLHIYSNRETESKYFYILTELYIDRMMTRSRTKILQPS